MSYFFLNNWLGKGKSRPEGQFVWISPAEGAELPVGSVVHVRLTAPDAVDSASLTVSGDAPIDMVVVPRVLRVAILGQSNAVGGGDAPGRLPITGIKYDEAVGSSTDWTPESMTERLGLEVSIRSNDAHGCEFGFIERMRSLNHNIVALAKYAVNGSGLTIDAVHGWNPAESPSQIYAAAVTWLLTRQAEMGSPFDVVLWIQGESDANTDAAATQYEANLLLLASSLRTDLGNLVLCANRLNIGANMAHRDTLRASQMAAQEASPVFIRIVDVDSVPLGPDATHYLSAGHDAVGRLLAERVARSVEVQWSPAVEDATTELVVNTTRLGAIRNTSRIVSVVETSPEDIANLKLWFRGDVGIVGNPVDSWTDTVSGLVLSETGALRQSAAVGGGVTFSAATHNLKSNVSLSTLRWMHTAGTFFWLLDRDDDISTRYFFNTSTNVATDVGVIAYSSSLGRVSFRVANGTGTFYLSMGGVSGSVPSDSAYRVLVAAYDETGGVLYVDGTTTPVATADVVGLPSNADPGYQLNGINVNSRLLRTEREIIAYDRKLTTHEIDLVIAYLQNKYL